MQMTQAGQRLALRFIVQAGLGLGLCALCLAVLATQLAGFDTAAMSVALGAVGWAQWGAAALAVAVSYAAIGQYDVLVGRHLCLGRPAPQMRRAGISALAISQTLGLGLLSGTLVRWRMLPNVSFSDAFRLTLAVSLSFLLAAGLVGALALALLANGGAGMPVIATAAIGVILALCLWRPQLARFRWPNLYALFGMVSLAAIDVAAAGCALWVLLPPGTVSATSLAPAFLLALGAGLISGSPAGLGPFELVLLGHLPTTPPEVLLAAVMAWRMIYFAAPSLLVLPLLASGPVQRRASTSGQTRTAQGHGFPLGRTGHLVAAMGSVPRGQEAAAIAQLRQIAAEELRAAVLYKAPPRLAAVARAQGLLPLIVAHDAVIRMARFDLTAPACAGLRRKLRKAAKAGVVASFAPHPDWAALAPVATVWARAHGGERGFSMGRFCAADLAGQRVYVATCGAESVAFISLRTGDAGWTLDLMRHTSDAPDGTMHALVLAALTDAHRLGVPEFSLAAVPVGVTAGANAVMRGVAWAAGGRGLWQFKSAFAPVWQPRYLVAGSRLGLVLAAISLTRAIHRPGPIQPPMHDDLAGNTFA